MRKLGWMSVVFVSASTLVAAVVSSGESYGVLNGLSRSIWVLPFSSSIISISLLVGSLGLNRLAPVGLSVKHLSWAYLSIGPSLALLSMAASLGIPTPALVGFVAPAMLPISAWAYYHSLGPSEEAGLGASRGFDLAEPEIWAAVDAADLGGPVQNLE